MTLIEQKRFEMQLCGLVNGLTHPLTIQLSQELDELLNKYQEEMKNERIDEENTTMGN